MGLSLYDGTRKEGRKRMKNYLIRRKVHLGLETEHWLYVSSLGLQPDLPVTIREVPLARISEGIRTFET